MDKTEPIEYKLKIAQFWGIIVIAFCIIVITISDIIATYKEQVEYIPRRDYVLKIIDNGKKMCILLEVENDKAILDILDRTGLDTCY